MFELLVLLLALVGADFTAYGAGADCTIAVHSGPAPIVRAVEEFNDIPDALRHCEVG
jgi:hypothetical protein